MKKIILLIAACTTAAACNNAAPGEATRETIDAPAFDGDSAFALLERQVAFGPRVPGTAGHRAQLEWMTDFLRARADTVIVQRFTHRRANGDSVPMANVFARFRPEAQDRVLVLAHWDTRPMADQEENEADRSKPIPGANDGASGVAVLLQLANVLSSHSPPIGVDLLFTDGEDFGPGEMYLGAKYFAANKDPGYRPFYGVLLDLIADQSPRFPIEGNSQSYAPEVVARVWDMAERLGYGSVFPSTTGGYIEDDHIPLNQAGIRTIDIIDFDYGPGNRYWHTLEDDLQNVAPGGLQAVGDVVTHLIFSGG